MSFTIEERQKKDGTYYMAMKVGPDVPPIDNLPKAGPPHNLPPPIVEGQQIAYRFHDDATADCGVSAIAVRANGIALQWVETERHTFHRAMVGTYNLQSALEKATLEAHGDHMLCRERWLASRFVFHTGNRAFHEKISPEQFRQICASHNLQFQRRVGFADGHEELFVNGKFDSAFKHELNSLDRP